jgi:hypothetical protein
MPEDNIISDTSPVLDTLGITETISNCYFPQCSEQELHTCRKCERKYCVMHTNKFSPNFCGECFKNLQAIEAKFTRTFDDYSTLDDKVTIHKETHTKYYMDGMDWPFLGVWVHRLSEEELRVWWVFHHSIMKLIEVENETRRIEKSRKLREQGIGLITGFNKKAGVSVKITKSPDTAEDVRKKLKKQGIPDNIIDMMIATMGAK